MSPIFRYPQQIFDDNMDYIRIYAYEYIPPGVGELSATNFTIPTSDSSYQSISKKSIKGTIILPMPQVLPNNSQSAQWGEGKLSGVTAAGVGVAKEGIEGGVSGLFQGVKGLVGKVTSSATTGLGQKAIENFFASKAVEQLLGQNQDLFGELLSRDTGAVINENVELLFRGVNLRGSMDFSFDLAPRSQKESQNIKDMVIFLKQAMSPRKGSKSGAAGGLFLTAPYVFKIEYMSGKNPHPYLNRFKMCALTNLNLSFTSSNTYATYSDGTPVHMQLSLSFQELTPIYAEDYQTDNPEANLGVAY